MGRALVMSRGCKRGMGCSSSISMAIKAAKLMNDMKKAELLEALQEASSAPVIKKVSSAFSDGTTAENLFPRNPSQPLSPPCTSNAVKSTFSCPDLGQSRQENNLWTVDRS